MNETAQPQRRRPLLSESAFTAARLEVRKRGRALHNNDRHAEETAAANSKAYTRIHDQLRFFGF